MREFSEHGRWPYTPMGSNKKRGTSRDRMKYGFPGYTGEAKSAPKPHTMAPKPLDEKLRPAADAVKSLHKRNK